MLKPGDNLAWLLGLWSNLFFEYLIGDFDDLFSASKFETIYGEGIYFYRNTLFPLLKLLGN